jgi:hypothetical protein
MWNCQIGLYGVFVVGYELPLLWNNLLTPREEIKSEINLLWSVAIRWQNVDVYKGFDGKNNTWSRLVCLCKTFATCTNLCMLKVRFYTIKKLFPFLFGDKGVIVDNFKIKNHLDHKDAKGSIRFLFNNLLQG